MGQYFAPTVLDTHGTAVAQLTPSDYGFSAKLIHGQDERFVNIAASLLALDSPVRLGWVGDYYEPTEDMPQVRWSPSTRDVVFDCVWTRCRDEAYGTPVNPTDGPIPVLVTEDTYPYLLNVDREEYVDVRHGPVTVSRYELHPLVSLTLMGGGMPVGRWAGQRISVSATAPQGWTQRDLRSDEGDTP